MRKDTITQSLAILNKLWSSEAVRFGRRTSEVHALIGGRLTMGLAVQPETLRSFFDSADGLARGMGFVARFLIAWPDSTQGTRSYRDAPGGWPGLSAFNARLGALLDLPLQMDESGKLAPKALRMTPEGFDCWREAHDAIEAELASGGEYADIRDCASKAGENLARIAALFHLFERGLTGCIEFGHVHAASVTIVLWHLREARRCLGTMALSKVSRDAHKLD